MPSSDSGYQPSLRASSADIPQRDRALALYNTVTQRGILWNSPNLTQSVS
ncbi:MAG: hypothetical protein KME12_17000 [Trichocoleus desertorum ATA4-8-CV12]|nr:hypothetical protein [Trichocoleus desertorum ATA4-8-CV12]